MYQLKDKLAKCTCNEQTSLGPVAGSTGVCYAGTYYAHLLVLA